MSLTSMKCLAVVFSLVLIGSYARAVDDEELRKMCIAAMVQTRHHDPFSDEGELEKQLVVSPELHDALAKILDRDASLDWKSFTKPGLDPAFADEAMRVVAKMWVTRIGNFVGGAKEWTAAEKAAVVHEMGRMISERANVKDEGKTWSHNVYRTQDGSYVIAGLTHELIILNVPGSPFRFRRVSARFSLLSRKDRLDYYRTWDAAVEDRIEKIE